MAKFSVFVPPVKGSDMPALTVKVEASNWLVALKQGLQQVGEQGGNLANIVCETAADGSLRVADPASRRVFTVTKLPDTGDDEFQKMANEQEQASRAKAEAAAADYQVKQQALKEMEVRHQAAAPQPQAQAPVPPSPRVQAPVAPAPKPTPQPVVPPQPVVQAPPPPPPPGPSAQELQMERERQKLEEERRKLAEEKRRLEEELLRSKQQMDAAVRQAVSNAAGMVGKVEVEKTAAPKDGWGDLDDWYDGVDVQEQTLDDVLSDIFMATADLHEYESTDAAKRVLDIAVDHVQSEAASVFFSDMNSPLKDLVLVSAKGPVAKKIIGTRIPLGKGVVGFSVVNGVRLIVNNVNKNPNFYGEVDKKSGFQTRSLLCVPIQCGDRTFGAIELINKPGNVSEWTTFESNVLESLGRLLGQALDRKFAAEKL